MEYVCIHCAYRFFSDEEEVLAIDCPGCGSNDIEFVEFGWDEEDDSDD